MNFKNNIMKILIYFLLIGSFIISCDSKNLRREADHRYQLGDLVNLKMDSTEVMIIGIYTLNRDIALYKVKHKIGDLEYKKFDVHEFELIKLDESSSDYYKY
jgi:hypothetical protein